MAQNLDKEHKKTLLAALALSLVMFFLEITMSYKSHSVSLLADSINFISNAFVYAIGISAVGKAVKLKAATSLLKASIIFVFAVSVIGMVSYNLFMGVVPEVKQMGAVSALALVANITIAALLFKHRENRGDGLQVWLFTRSEVLGNIAVIAAAFLVYLTNTNLPDLAVALIMAFMALFASLRIFRKGFRELRLTGFPNQPISRA